ncbi:MAG: ATP-binding protein [Magnetospirillum sp. WYHS-4]
MAVRPFPRRETGSAGEPDAEAVLNGLAVAVVVVDPQDTILRVNVAAENLLQGSAAHLRGLPLRSLLPADSPVFGVTGQARAEICPVSEYGVEIDTPRIGKHLLNIQASPAVDSPGYLVLTFQERSIADKIDRQLTHRGAARSVSAMASMLAHEVKNPLSGIRGAAQLLEQSSESADDQSLARLIRDESDRICALVDRMQVFSDRGPAKHNPVNIHLVLDRVRQLAQAGFGRHVRFIEVYDPSLPAVPGDHDQLVQVFLNLVKNAVEAAPKDGGEVVLSTAYRHGLRFSLPGSDTRVHLPLMVSVQDNGDGIPEDLQPHLFDPFVTTKPKGSGLGLALVAKIVGDHGGVVEFDSQPRRTVFRVMLPMMDHE